MVIQITIIKKSPRENKRFRVYLNDETFYDFGLKGGETYIDHYNKEMRFNYRARHLANGSENQLIKMLFQVLLCSHIIYYGDHQQVSKKICFF